MQIKVAITKNCVFIHISVNMPGMKIIMVFISMF